MRQEKLPIRRPLKDMPCRDPPFWAFIMLLCPLLSVVPQKLIYRAFLFQHYCACFRAEPADRGYRGNFCVAAHSAAELAGAVSNTARRPVVWLALPRTRSVLASAFEHALYGCAVLTLGLGAYFYTRAAR